MFLKEVTSKERGLLRSSKRPNRRSEASGKSPAEGKDGQAEEGAEGGVERLNLGRGLGSSAPPVAGAVRFVAHGDVTPAWKEANRRMSLLKRAVIGWI